MLKYGLTVGWSEVWAGLGSLETLLSRGKLEHQNVWTLQIVVNYLVLVKIC